MTNNIRSVILFSCECKQIRL